MHRQITRSREGRTGLMVTMVMITSATNNFVCSYFLRSRPGAGLIMLELLMMIALIMSGRTSDGGRHSTKASGWP